jgi:hypothetical protein
MMEAEGIIGFTLKDARIMMNNSGRKIGTIKLTSEPKSDPLEIEESFRVVNVVKDYEENYVLVVCKPL